MEKYLIKIFLLLKEILEIKIINLTGKANPYSITYELTSGIKYDYSYDR